MLIQILTDNPNSWIVPFIVNLSQELEEKGHTTKHLFNHEDVEEGDVLLLLSCEQKFTKLNLNKYNLVVHESALPKGKGWSPLTWQVIEGVRKIPITLFEATSSIDAGLIYLQEFIELDGTELLNELRTKQVYYTFSMIVKFITSPSLYPPKEQIGESSYYRRRDKIDSKLDIDKSIKSQFSLLQVCDNERYPAYFELNNCFYTLKIEKI
jgi:methionyl-tRNA formyltransferase